MCNVNCAISCKLECMRLAMVPRMPLIFFTDVGVCDAGASGALTAELDADDAETGVAKRARTYAATPSRVTRPSVGS